MFSSNRKPKVNVSAQSLSDEISPHTACAMGIRSCEYTEGSTDSLEVLWIKASGVSSISTVC